MISRQEWSLYDTCAEKYNKGNLEAALKGFDKLIKASIDNAHADKGLAAHSYRGRAIIHLFLGADGADEKANKDVEQGRALDPTYSILFCSVLAIVYKRAGLIEKAIAYLNDSLTASASILSEKYYKTYEYRTHIELGQLYMKQNNTEKAILEFVTVLENPETLNYSKVYSALQLLKLGRKVDLEPLVEKLEKLTNKTATANCVLALAQASMGQYDKAVTTCRQLMHEFTLYSINLEFLPDFLKLLTDPKCRPHDGFPEDKDRKRASELKDELIKIFALVGQEDPQLMYDAQLQSLCVPSETLLGSIFYIRRGLFAPYSQFGRLDLICKQLTHARRNDPNFIKLALSNPDTLKKLIISKNSPHYNALFLENIKATFEKFLSSIGVDATIKLPNIVEQSSSENKQLSDQSSPPAAISAVESPSSTNEQGNLDNDISRHTQTMQLYLNYILAKCLRGVAYRDKGDYAQALEDIKGAWELASKLEDNSQLKIYTAIQLLRLSPNEKINLHPLIQSLIIKTKMNVDDITVLVLAYSMIKAYDAAKKTYERLVSEYSLETMPEYLKKELKIYKEQLVSSMPSTSAIVTFQQDNNILDSFLGPINVKSTAVSIPPVVSIARKEEKTARSLHVAHNIFAPSIQNHEKQVNQMLNAAPVVPEENGDLIVFPKIPDEVISRDREPSLS